MQPIIAWEGERSQLLHAFVDVDAEFPYRDPAFFNESVLG